MAEKRKGDNAGDDQFDITGATTEKAGSIQAIDRGSVHRICSGQVVLTLAIAVKELVENSVDAGATSVEVKLKEYGSEVIEVSDNGTGVEEKNFEGLTLKHHTSKIQDFSDLVGVETFGFRGEALSSLCALSNLSVTTCHTAASVGTRLEFDHHGKITGRAPCPRQRGTTVTLQNLFSTLPVRYREFQRNLKKEYAKMVQVLNAYCLVTTGVRISCTNQVGKGSRSTVVSTKGNTTLRENIGNIFGPKCLQSLLEFKQYEPSEEICSWYNVKPTASTQQLFRIEGFISKCEHGQGRSSSDRQFIFINSRPCDSAKLSKIINEVYHSYNRHQYPFVVLTITMDRDSVDVNVTPDKRQIFLQGEKLLLATIKTSLVKLFEPTTSVLKINSFLTYSSRVSKEEDSSDTESETSVQEVPRDANSRKKSAGSTLLKLKRSFSSAFAKDDGSGNKQFSSPESKQQKLDHIQSLTKSLSLPPKLPSEGSPSISRFLSKHSQKLNESSEFLVPASPSSLSPLSQTEESFRGGNSSPKGNCSNEERGVSKGDNSHDKEEYSTCETPESLTPSPVLNHESIVSPKKIERTSKVDNFLSNLKSKLSNDPVCVNRSKITSPNSRSSASSQESRDSDVFIVPQIDSEEIPTTECVDHVNHSGCITENREGLNETSGRAREQPEERRETDLDDEASTRADQEHSEDGSRCHVTLLEYDEKEAVQKKEKSLPFSFTSFKARQQARNTQSQQDENANDFSRAFRAQITPGDSQSAEDELQREIKKDMFPKMEIVGQFNLGFILAKLGDDLFIVDQHATDEKYNFEMLQRHTVIQSQKLIHPQNLELTSSNETILIDNLDIFKKNGFDFVIDEEAPPTQRVKLSSTPVSKNWNFGKEDIEELVFMLTDSPGVMCRPSRIRMMFASRACRKAIMIGTALNKAEMKRLLSHMGEIEQPWNCPHGRPTMRHLFNLNMLPK